MNRKIRLGNDDMKSLLIDGKVECPYEGNVLVGSTYPVYGMDLWVNVDSSHEVNGVKFVVFVVTDKVEQGRLRKVSIQSRRDDGAFIGGKSKFAIGEEVAVCEMYSYLCDMIMKKDGKEACDAYKNRLAEAHNIEVRMLQSLAGWCNKKYVMPELMPRRVRIVSADRVKVLDISDDDWHAMGVDWTDKYEIAVKRQYATPPLWDTNCEVTIYRYTTLSGSVQMPRDLFTLKEIIEKVKNGEKI